MAKVGQEIFQAIGIDRSLYCSECCYNLMTRPKIGRCPECGNEYDARAGAQRGVLIPQLVRWPLGDLFYTLISGAISGVAFYYTVKEREVQYLIAGLPFIVLALLLLRGTWKKFWQTWRINSLQREADRQDEDAD